MVACLFVTLAILGTIFNLSFQSTLTSNVIQNKESNRGGVSLLNHDLGYDENGNLRVTGTLKIIIIKPLIM